MKTGLTALCLWNSLISRVSANKDIITLNANGNAWIQEATATLVLPQLPDEVTGDIALWSAIMMNDFSGDFLQGVTQSSPAYLSSFAYHAMIVVILTSSTAPWDTATSTADGATLHTRSKVYVSHRSQSLSLT